MPQISKGETFADSQQLTAIRLNQLVDSAQLLVGAISDQPSITTNTLEATDTTIVNDGGTLKKATISDILNSGLEIKTSVVNANANSDIVVNPNDALPVLGSSYVSANGINVTVTTLASHGLSVNNVVQISGAGAGYNGAFRITSVTSNTFQYAVYTPATPTASPTSCTYTRKGSSIINGSEVVSQNLFVGNEIDTLNLQVDGQANINSANVTTAIQYSGVPVFGLSSIEEVTVPFDQANATTEALRLATCNQWRTVASLTSQTKTNKEIWVIEADFPLVYFPWMGGTKFSIYRLSTATNIALEVSFLQNNGANYISSDQKQIKMKCVIPESVTFTGETFQLRFRYNAINWSAGALASVGFGGSLTDADITRTLRVTKYHKP
jgi:hypothetical protein